MKFGGFGLQINYTSSIVETWLTDRQGKEKDVGVSIASLFISTDDVASGAISKSGLMLRSERPALQNKRVLP